MAWRESLEDARGEAELGALHDEVMATRKQMLTQLAATLDEQRDWHAAAQQVRALMFVERFAHDVEQRLDALGQ